MILPDDKIQPDYNVYYYKDNFYKVIRFNRKKVGNYNGLYRERKSDSHEKCDASISRARRFVLDVCLSNNFSFFFTGTLSPETGDRFDIRWYHKKLSQFIRDQRKKYNSKIEFILVPEQHKNGAWHFHGLINVPDMALSKFPPTAPRRLLEGLYFNWPDYAKSFGFVSLSPVRDFVACAFYMSKYITKDLGDRINDIGGHLYYCSQGLNRALLQDSFYGSNSDLDRVLTHHYEFCSTGFCNSNDWTFGINTDDILDYRDIEIEEYKEMEEIVYEQTCFL